MKILIVYITVLLFFISQPAFGQSIETKKTNTSDIFNNYIGLQGGMFLVKNKENLFPWFGTFGINYNRRVHTHWHIEASYMMWLPGELGLFGEDHYWIERKVDGTPYKVGELVVSEYYKMVDASALYNLTGLSSKHKILGGVGLTRYWGDNYYIKGISQYHPSSYMRGAKVREAFWGVCPQLTYCFSFLGKRLSIGFTYKSRHLFNKKMSTERNFLMTAGYNL